MATHDYVIDNSTGANVRTDINNVLQAILTNNSSSSAPSTTAAYMWWADTTNGILKIRNSANNGWVELLQLDGTLTLEDGSATSPALAFRDNLNTGIYSAAGNRFNIAVGGTDYLEMTSTLIVFNDTGVDTDFKIEGDDDANLFYLDAGNDRIGIGTDSPGLKFHIQDGALSSAPSPNTNCDVVIEGSSSTGIQFLSSSQTQIRFGDAASTGAGSIIYSHSDDNFKLNYSNGGFLSFNDGSGETARIDDSGRLLLGTTTEGQANADNLTIDGGDAETGITIRSGTSRGNHIYFSDGTSGDDEYRGIISYQHSSNKMQFFTDTIERMTIDSSGRIGIGTTSPSQQLTVAYSNSSPWSTSSLGVGMKVENTNTVNGVAAGLELRSFQNNGGASIQYIHAVNDGVSSYGSDLVFSTRVAYTGAYRESCRITNLGNLKFPSGHGIDFSATSDLSGKTSELLHDYEEGTYVPVLTGSVSNPTQSYAWQLGHYTKVGRIVHVSVDLSMASSGVSGGSGTVLLSLPFNQANLPGNQGIAASIGYAPNWGSGTTPTALYSSPNDTIAYLMGNDKDNGQNFVSSSVVTNSTRIIIGFSYITET